jgi:hypothetical protein
MKTLILSLAVMALTIPMMACEHTVAENDRTHRNWDGSVTHESTTVKQNDVTGSTSVEKDKGRY